MKDRTMALSTFIHNMIPFSLRRWADRQSGNPASSEDHAVRTTARKGNSTGDTNGHVTHYINRALDRAMALGLFDHAERIVRSALRLGEQTTPQLIERIARLRLIQGHPDTALQVIDIGCDETNSLRMLRIVCQTLVGLRLDAHVELHRWSQHNTCPLEARCLLALLDAEMGQTDDALRELHKNIRQLDDPQTFELMVLLAASCGRRDLAARWTGRLSSIIQSREAKLSPQLLAESLDLPIRQSIVITNEDVESLAGELVVNEPIIPALVTAQELEPETSVAELLYRAIEHALPELSQRDAALESLVRLALALDERGHAAKWVEAAIDENRITASMAQHIRDLLDDPTKTSRLIGHDDDDGVIGRVIDAQHDAKADTNSEKPWKRAA